MSEEIIVPLISGSLAIVGSFVGNYAVSLKKSREDAIKEAEREQAQKDQLSMILDEQKKIKERLDSHNGYAEKFAENSKSLAVMAEKQAYLAKSVDKLQKDIEYIRNDRCKIN